MEVTTGLCLLGQPVGSPDFAAEFNAEHLSTNRAEAARLLAAVLDRHTALRLFTQCTLHKLPHLLGTEMLYSDNLVNGAEWDTWDSPLSRGVDSMVDGFLAELTGCKLIPNDSQLIAYVTIA